MRILFAAFAALSTMVATAHAGDAKAAIEESVAAFEATFARGDGAGLAGFYGDGAVVMPPGAAALTGNEPIAAFWQSLIDSGVARADLVIDDVMEAGADTLIERGHFAMFDKAGQSAGEGKYVVVWKKQGGDWKIVRDIWNDGR